MKSRFIVWVCALLSLAVLPTVAMAENPSLSSEPEQFQVKEKTEVPNTTLQPGSYSIRILDHLSDRVILQVSGKSNHVQTTFLAIPAATMANAPVGPILYSTGSKGKAALKGFAFPGGTAVEFVYPKNDAVTIAQANGTRVMAIDPASEGRVAAPKLNQSDMQMITLWMLEPARVGPDDAKPTIAASKYHPPVTAEAPAPAETAQAPAPTPAPVAAPAETASAQPEPQSAPAPVATPRPQRPVELAQNDAPPAPAPVRRHVRPANVTALPHTASMLPLLWLGSFGFLAFGGGLTLRRVAARG